MSNESETVSESLFESIKHINGYGQEYWYARELQIALQYKRWDKFFNTIEKAMNACQGSGFAVSDHFSHLGRMVDVGSGARDRGQSVPL